MFLKVYNEVVCNCHEDSKLLDVISLVETVYQADTQRERVKYGRRLQKAIRIFLKDFTHHMEEEESIFQPLLVENFDSKELKDMKEIVQKQHSLFREKVKSEKSLKALKVIKLQMQIFFLPRSPVLNATMRFSTYY